MVLKATKLIENDNNLVKLPIQYFNDVSKHSNVFNLKEIDKKSILEGTMTKENQRDRNIENRYIKTRIRLSLNLERLEDIHQDHVKKKIQTFQRFLGESNQWLSEKTILLNENNIKFNDIEQKTNDTIQLKIKQRKQQIDALGIGLQNNLSTLDIKLAKEIEKIEYLFSDEKKAISANKKLLDTIYQQSSQSYNQKIKNLYQQIDRFSRAFMDNQRTAHIEIIKRFEQMDNESIHHTINLQSTVDSFISMSISSHTQYIQMLNQLISDLQITCNQHLVQVSQELEAIKKLYIQINQSIVGIESRSETNYKRFETTSNYLNDKMSFIDEKVMNILRHRQTKTLHLFEEGNKILHQFIQFTQDQFNSVFNKTNNLSEKYTTSVNLLKKSMSSLLEKSKSQLAEIARQENYLSKLKDIDIEWMISLVQQSLITIENEIQVLSNDIKDMVKRITKQYDKIDTLHQYLSFSSIFKNEELLALKIKHAVDNMQNNFHVKRANEVNVYNHAVIKTEYDSDNDIVMSQIKLLDAEDRRVEKTKNIQFDIAKKVYAQHLKTIEHKNSMNLLSNDFDLHQEIIEKDIRLNEELYKLELSLSSSAIKYDDLVHRLTRSHELEIERLKEKEKSLHSKLEFEHKNHIIQSELIDHELTQLINDVQMSLGNALNELTQKKKEFSNQYHVDLKQLEYALGKSRLIPIKYREDHQTHISNLNTKIETFIHDQNEIRLLQNHQQQSFILKQKIIQLSTIIQEFFAHIVHIESQMNIQVSQGLKDLLQRVKQRVTEIEFSNLSNNKKFNEISKILSELKHTIDQIGSFILKKIDENDQILINAHLYSQQKSKQKYDTLIKKIDSDIHKIQTQIQEKNNAIQSNHQKRKEKNVNEFKLSQASIERLIESVKDEIEKRSNDQAKYMIQLNSDFEIEKQELQSNYQKSVNSIESAHRERFNKIEKQKEEDFILIAQETEHAKKLHEDRMEQVEMTFKSESKKIIQKIYEQKQKLIELKKSFETRRVTTQDEHQMKLSQIEYDLTIQQQNYKTDSEIFSKNFDQKITVTKQDIQKLNDEIEVTNAELMQRFSNAHSSLSRIITETVYIPLEKVIELHYKNIMYYDLKKLSHESTLED